MGGLGHLHSYNGAHGTGLEVLGDEVGGHPRARQREGPGVRYRVAATAAALYGAIASLLIEEDGPVKILTNLKRHWSRTMNGSLTRLATKVAAYTCRQLLNAHRRPCSP